MGVGRPRRHTESYQLRASRGRFDSYRAAARGEGRTLASWIRRALDSAAGYEEPREPTKSPRRLSAKLAQAVDAAAAISPELARDTLKRSDAAGAVTVPEVRAALELRAAE